MGIWSCGLILFFLISSLALPFHHHNDSAFHSDCPICISVNLPFLSNQSTSLIQALFQSVAFDIPEAIVLVPNHFINLQAPRAPPFI